MILIIEKSKEYFFNKNYSIKIEKLKWHTFLTSILACTL